MITPQNGRIVVKPLSSEDKVTASGIIVANKETLDEAMRGVVEHAGDSSYKVGETVIYSRYGADKVSIKAEEFHLVSTSNILGTL